MTSRWRIFSRSNRVFMWATFLSCLPLTAGALTGRVELRNSRDPGVQKRRDFSGVVIWLEPAGGKSISRVAARRVQMVQKSKRFTPHILAIPLGTTVEFPNFDPIFHNAFSNFSGQPFDIGLYPP